MITEPNRALATPKQNSFLTYRMLYPKTFLAFLSKKSQKKKKCNKQGKGNLQTEFAYSKYIIYYA